MSNIDDMLSEYALSDEPVLTKDSVLSPTDEELASIYNGVSEDYNMDEPNSARAIKEAADSGLKVVYPADDELQIDIDTNHGYAIYQQMFPILERYYSVLAMKDEPSRSGLPKRHITLALGKKLTNFERIALQLAMGSDRVREILSIVQEREKDPHPTLFLEKEPQPLVIAPETDRSVNLIGD